MPTYKITYFNFRGRAELARLIFAAAGVPYEDLRIEMSRWPVEYKDQCPFGQLPLLEVDGKVLAQSKTIARYLAREFNLAGKDSREQALADMILDHYADIMNEMKVLWLESDAEKKATLLQKFKTETLSKHLGYLETILRQNGGGGGFIVGDSLTWADLMVVDSNDWLGVMFPNPYDNFPLLAGLVKRVREMPQVAEWIAKRPDTPR